MRDVKVLGLIPYKINIVPLKTSSDATHLGQQIFLYFGI
jgi:hypothetical protein